MTVRELINKLLDRPMDDDVQLYYDKGHIDEYDEHCRGYLFDIDDVKGSEIIFTDWREGRK